MGVELLVNIPNFDPNLYNASIPEGSMQIQVEFSPFFDLESTISESPFGLLPGETLAVLLLGWVFDADERSFAIKVNVEEILEGLIEGELMGFNDPTVKWEIIEIALKNV